MFANEIVCVNRSYNPEMAAVNRRRRMLPPWKTRKAKKSFYTGVFDEKPPACRRKLTMSSEDTPVMCKENESQDETVFLHQTRDGKYQGVLTRTIDLGGKSDSDGSTKENIGKRQPMMTAALLGVD